jgi:pheromone shutdown protein TraB
MLKFKNIKLIGSSHIAKQSVEEINKACENINPDIIAIELDSDRLAVLVSETNVVHDEEVGLKNKKVKGFSKKRSRSLLNIFKIGLNGYIFSLIGEFAEKKLGNIVGTKPGVDMLSAYKFARKNNRKIALIDQNIKITLKKLSKTITWKEKWQFVKDLFNAFVLKKPDPGFDLKDLERLDLNKVPSDKLINKMMKQTKKKYPNLYKTLVEDRNKVMAKNLVILSKKFPEENILAIVGAGHEKEMGKLMKNMYNLIDSSSSLPKNIITKNSNNHQGNENENNSFSYKIKIDTENL